VPDRFTPTYLKPRDARNRALSGEHDRYDIKNRRHTPAAAEEQLLAHLAKIMPGVDAVVVLDQVDEAECGVVTERVRTRIAELGAGGPPKLYWADSRCRAGLFRNVIVKVNEAEVVRTFGSESESGSELRRAIGELRRRTGKPVFVTAGARGIWVSDPTPTLVPTLPVEGPIDPTGAGDSATAGAVLALCARGTLREAALMGNLVASITIQQLATTGTASPSQLGPRLEEWRRTHR
jgi:bifunctional ADP-heptose synthase (sugar kinase/adenylyltransferase)